MDLRAGLKIRIFSSLMISFPAKILKLAFVNADVASYFSISIFSNSIFVPTLIIVVTFSA